MRITTESGAYYDIDERHICTKTDKYGYVHAPFKVWYTKAIDPNVQTWDEVQATEFSKPEVGKRMFLAGKDDSWLSTVVVKIEEDEAPPSLP